MKPEAYGYFLKSLFDVWYQDQIRGEDIYIRYFDNLLGIQMGIEPESCGLMGHCTPQLVIEADGTCYPCDFYVMDKYKMGNLTEDSLEDILKIRAAIQFARESAVPEKSCRNCRYGYLCRGGCRRDRDDGSCVGENYYCEAYRDFFAYTEQRLLKLSRILSVRGN